MADLSHCGKIIYTHDRDRFLLSLFATGRRRDALQVVYALNTELMQIQGKVSEPVIGQMRLAWWQEAIEALYEGQVRRGQPVLESLQPVVQYVPKEMLVALVGQYREHFPELPLVDDTLETFSLQLLRSLCPEAEPRFRKAHGIIASHRRRYGCRRNGWMSFRLLTGV